MRGEYSYIYHKISEAYHSIDVYVAKTFSVIRKTIFDLNKKFSAMLKRQLFNT